MRKIDPIIGYLTEAYSPEAIIVYGSFADGSAGEDSDFDALVIADGVKKHDSSEVGGTMLDVWVYPPRYFAGEVDPHEFIQVCDGIIVLDKNGTAGKLKSMVRTYADRLPLKTDEEIGQEIGWCEKMFRRTKRGDAEGFYRWHWLLSDSLEIYFDAKKLPYFGPKKALRYMEKEDREGFRIYSAALSGSGADRLEEWIAYLKTLK